MTDWKAYPNLFANGKFYVETVAGIQQIQGISVGFHGDPGRYQEVGREMYMLDDGDIRPLSQCTLIARPILDMSDEEIRGVPSYKNQGYNIGYQLDCMIEEAECIFGEASDTMDSQRVFDFLYYLSIGVYPFSQDHFEDGTVIDATKREKK